MEWGDDSFANCLEQYQCARQHTKFQYIANFSAATGNQLA